MKEKKQKNINEFEIDDLVLSTYKQIADWHNDDGTQSGLKQVSFDLINNIAKAVFRHLDIPYNGEVRLDKEMRSEVLKFKQEKFGKENVEPAD